MRTDAGFQIGAVLFCRQNRRQFWGNAGHRRSRGLRFWSRRGWSRGNRPSFSRGQRLHVQRPLQAKNSSCEFAEKLAKLLQFAARRIHSTSAELISMALSAKLVGRFTNIQGDEP